MGIRAWWRRCSLGRRSAMVARPPFLCAFARSRATPETRCVGSFGRSLASPILCVSGDGGGCDLCHVLCHALATGRFSYAAMRRAPLKRPLILSGTPLAVRQELLEPFPLLSSTAPAQPALCHLDSHSVTPHRGRRARGPTA